jgi:hypothetical protein
MKKIISISLLVILCFNCIGYKFFANYFENKAIDDMQTAVYNNKYNEADLVSFKTALNQPYNTNTDGYDYVDGEMDVNGTYYQYVKMRVYNDTLEVLCIPNCTKSSISEKKEEWSKQLNDLANNKQSKKSSTTSLVKTIFSEFTGTHHFDIYAYNSILTLSHNTPYLLLSGADPLNKIAKPPKA